jgi:hypothetical protein
MTLKDIQFEFIHKNIIHKIKVHNGIKIEFNIPITSLKYISKFPEFLFKRRVIYKDNNSFKTPVRSTKKK